jgi:hypothetical protein
MGRPVSRGTSSPIHLAECRDRLLDALRGGASRVLAAESIGCNHKAFKRYLAANPEFEAKVEAAGAGLETVTESAEPAPAPLARVVVDAEPVDAAPCDAEKPSKRAPVDVTGLAERYGGRLMQSIETVIDDPDHPHFAAIAKLLFPAIYGPSVFRAMRAAQREEDRNGADDRPRVLIIRVPAGQVPE